MILYKNLSPRNTLCRCLWRATQKSIVAFFAERPRRIQQPTATIENTEVKRSAHKRETTCPNGQKWRKRVDFVVDFRQQLSLHQSDQLTAKIPFYTARQPTCG